MIYIIISTVTDDLNLDLTEMVDRKLESYPVVKIGFAQDSTKFSKRNSSYITHNPNYKVFRKIEGLGRKEELALHRHLRDLKINSNSREWFRVTKYLVQLISCPDFMERAMYISSVDRDRRWNKCR